MATRRVCDYPVRGEIHGVVIDRPVEVHMPNSRPVELDLCEEHAAPIAGLIEKVRPTAARTTTRRAKATGKKPLDTAAMRAWALEQGMNVSPKGMIPKDVQQAYAKAH